MGLDAASAPADRTSAGTLPEFHGQLPGRPDGPGVGPGAGRGASGRTDGAIRCRRLPGTTRRDVVARQGAGQQAEAVRVIRRIRRYSAFEVLTDSKHKQVVS